MHHPFDPQPYCTFTTYVADSGIAAENTHFGGRASGAVAPGAPFATPEDESGHGSHVAGIAAGSWTGEAPAARVVGVRCLNDTNHGTLQDVIFAANCVAAAKVASRGAKVVMALSLRLRGSFQGLKAVLKRAAEAGVMVVAAVGRTPADSCIWYPDRSKNIITVAAQTRNDSIVSFSAFFKCVDVAAPGVDILSVEASGHNLLSLGNGTSAATPHVAGLAALVLAEDPDGADLQNEQVLERLTRDAPIAAGYRLAWANPSCESQVRWYRRVLPRPARREQNWVAVQYSPEGQRRMLAWGRG